jgi:hypothetical protein
LHAATQPGSAGQPLASARHKGGSVVTRRLCTVRELTTRAAAVSVVEVSVITCFDRLDHAIAAAVALRLPAVGHTTAGVFGQVAGFTDAPQQRQ